MKKVKLIYEGKAKKVYETEKPDLLIQEFKKTMLRLLMPRKEGLLKIKGYVITGFQPRFFSCWKIKEWIPILSSF